MGRYLGPKCKLSRREGVDLQFKSGIKDIEKKCKFNTIPGSSNARKFRMSDYGIQLREKQKVKRMYGILEKQFKNYYTKALRIKGNTGYNLLLLLESRLDNIVYKMGFGSTRAEARQIISHKNILLNNKICNIPSCIIKSGDIISIKEKAKNHERILRSIKLAQNKESIKWLKVDFSKLTGIYNNAPSRNELDANINEKLIVELYSK